MHLFGVIGDDDPGDKLVRYCEELAIDVERLVRIENRPTTCKTRVLGPRQQLLRLDWETTDPWAAGLEKELLADLAEGPRPTAVLLSDYGKGFLSPATIEAFLEASGGAPVLVDPKGRDFSRYRGASILTPNLLELEGATGSTLRGQPLPVVAEAARSLFPLVGLDTVLVTLGERGMLIVPRDGEAEHIPARAREVYDVTGAGDTVIAVLAVALSTGATLEDAARIANVAAGMVVDEVGAAAVESSALLSKVSGRQVSKAFSRPAVTDRVEAWRRQGKRIVFTNGCFDLLHAGHLWLLHQAADLGDILVVGLNTDSSVRRLKGADRPLVSEADRVAMLAALECVDAVVPFDEDTPHEIIRYVQPDILVKGADYAIDEVVGRRLVESRGGAVVLVQLLPEHSTSALIERIFRGRPKDTLAAESPDPDPSP